MKNIERREFVKTLAAAGVAIACPGAVRTAHPARRLDKVGLQLYTVRDKMKDDFEGTLARVAEIGYKEVEAADPYNNMEPKQYRALLDKYGLTMPSTHSGAVDGPGLEKQLEGFQIMGLKYTEVSGGRGEPW